MQKVGVSGGAPGQNILQKARDHRHATCDNTCGIQAGGKDFAKQVGVPRWPYGKPTGGYGNLSHLRVASGGNLSKNNLSACMRVWCMPLAHSMFAHLAQIGTGTFRTSCFYNGEWYATAPKCKRQCLSYFASVDFCMHL